jgi:hypothetical protein
MCPGGRLCRSGAWCNHIDGVFGPYYLFMDGRTGLVGDSVFDLRFPWIVAMAGAVAVTGELGRRLFRPVVGVLPCLLPNTSRYAAEARPYAFAGFFATLALLFHRALDDPQARCWCAYGAAVDQQPAAYVYRLAALMLSLLLRSAVAAVGWHDPRVLSAGCRCGPASSGPAEATHKARVARYRPGCG